MNTVTVLRLASMASLALLTSCANFKNGPSFSSADDNGAAKPFAVTPVLKQPGPAPAVVTNSKNPIVQTAAKAGVRSCLNRIDQVTSFVARGNRAGANMFATPANAEQHLFSTSMELASDNSLAYASASFAAGEGGNCDGMYEAITYWPMNCQETAAKAFAELKPMGVVLRNIQMLDGGPKMRVYLMPADKACIAIKKEVVY